MMQVTFAELEQLLQSTGSAVGAAEGHGALCGALCASDDYTLERWSEEVIPDDSDAFDESAREALRLVYTDTRRALREDQMEFTPLLPEDDVDLEARAAALAQWCQGFLYGLGLSGLDPKAKLSADVQEILKDLTHIGRATVDAEALDEESESAYVELVEYLRAGTQLIHDEMLEVRARSAPPTN
jgi:yecA family protein